ncbi:unnamed protein product [Cladocopium goreaui]|uniref:Uncharacterized protein n=1 Tax=Cladocopium goreaui TaxID=2562237 RepID=A0A9P1C9H9_9DINO|nr:unnamed protein product [Cladocopium goreaui]
MLLVMAKKGVWVLEQPFSSLVFRMDCFQKMCRTTKVFKQSFWMRGWGSSTAKRTTLWANSSAVRFFSTTKKAKGKKSSKKLADIYYDATGRKRYKGNKALRASQQYPIGFGVRFAQTVKHLKNERSPLLDHSYAPCSSFIRNFDVMPGKGHRCRKFNRSGRSRILAVMASKPLQTFPSRQWSCSTLLRGSSFLSEQRAAHKDMNCDDLLSAARARLQKLKAQSIAFSPAASFAAGSFETPSPKQPTTVQRCPSDGPDRRVPCKSPELPNSKDKTQFRAATADLASACEEALQPDEVEPRTKKAMGTTLAIPGDNLQDSRP